MKEYNSIIILGPTASGKTKLAAHLANLKEGAVLSFDSRQVYKELTIGTGKDLEEFVIEGNTIPYFLIDICEVKTNFHSYEFVKKYIEAFGICMEKKKLPIICGGTGLYFDLALKQYQYINIPNNPLLRKETEILSNELLKEKLKSYPDEYTHQADTSTHKRLIRAIEIAQYLSEKKHQKIEYPELKPVILGINLAVEERKNKIEKRLNFRLEHGLIEEVENLLQAGILPEQLIYMGLEYKYVTEYIVGVTDKRTMTDLLFTAIVHYAKRQMTWFRKMEREGHFIQWIDGTLSLEEQISQAKKYL